ncbi:MAG: hypothetical protein J6Y64_06805 [Ruminococcus sp.]|nr:hypothetical protein [Ruminococcus sp.]
MILYDCNETKAMLLDDEGAMLDRADFVRNVGALASQTREGVISIEYAPETVNETEFAVIHYKGGATKLVNIRHNSYAAIVRDIFKQL